MFFSSRVSRGGTLEQSAISADAVPEGILLVGSDV